MGQTRSVNYDHDDAGNIKTQYWPNQGFSVDYEYDALDRIKKISQADTLLAEYSYDDLGRRKQLKLGNGRVIDYAYETDGMLDSITHVNLVDTDFDGLGDPAGTATWEFDYNKANQVSSKTLPEMFRWQPASSSRNVYTVNGLNQYTSTVQNGRRFCTTIMATSLKRACGRIIMMI